MRSLLAKMNIEAMEIAENGARTEFCGVSLYRAQPPRNPKLAPRHYREGAVGKFIPRSPEEQQAIMRDYCRKFGGGEVICYCHYCLEGLLAGGAQGRLIWRSCCLDRTPDEIETGALTAHPDESGKGAA